jgi:hypothetical protein
MLRKLFKSQENNKNVSLGRYSNYHQSDRQNLAWEKAIELHASKAFLESFKNLLEFLKQEGDQDNVIFQELKDHITFTLYQGSVKLTGKYEPHTLQVQAKLAVAIELPEKMMLRLLNKNYEFEYVKYALNEKNEILLVLNAGLADAQPHVILRGLKELATQADKLDDLLSSDFEKVNIIETTHVIEKHKTVRKANISFLKNQVDKLYKDLEEQKEIYEYLEFTRIYRIFNLVYAMDFLLTPQGQIMETLEIMHRELHNPDGQLEEKIDFFERELKSLSQIEEKQLEKELYEVFYTFNLTPKIDVQTLREIIDNERQQLEWYRDNGHQLIVWNIIGYIFGYCLFNYTLPDPIKKLIYFYYKCLFPEYFQQLDELPFVDKHNKLIKKNIKQEISKLSKSERWSEAKLQSAGRLKLDYENLTKFAYSLLDIIYELEFIEYDD